MESVRQKRESSVSPSRRIRLLGIMCVAVLLAGFDLNAEDEVLVVLLFVAAVVERTEGFVKNVEDKDVLESNRNRSPLGAVKVALIAEFSVSFDRSEEQAVVSSESFKLATTSLEGTGIDVLVVAFPLFRVFSFWKDGIDGMLIGGGGGGGIF